MSESFDHCRSSEIKIPSSVLEIENNAFTNCSNLEKITVDSNNSTYANNNQDGIIYDKNVKKLICYPMGKKDTSFTTPYGVETLCSNAFKGNYNLKEVILSKSVKEVTGATFEGTRLIDIKVDEANENYSNYNNDGALYNKDISKIIVYPRGKDETTFTIPNSVTTIGYEAFVNCNKMIEIIIPKGVMTIEDCAFGISYKLNKIFIPNSVTSIGANIGINELITGNTVKSAGIVTRTNSTAHQYAINNNLTVELDDTSPIIQSISYSTKETAKSVKVTITANEPIKTNVSDNRNWEYVPNTDKKSIVAEL